MEALRALGWEDTAPVGHLVRAGEYTGVKHIGANSATTLKAEWALQRTVEKKGP
jgi:hypothetical protein